MRNGRNLTMINLLTPIRETNLRSKSLLNLFRPQRAHHNCSLPSKHQYLITNRTREMQLQWELVGVTKKTMEKAPRIRELYFQDLIASSRVLFVKAPKPLTNNIFLPMMTITKISFFHLRSI